MSDFVIEHFHGAVTRIGVTESAVSHRELGYNFLIAPVWTDPATTDQNTAWTRATYTALEPYFARRRYVNYLESLDTEYWPGMVIGTRRCGNERIGPIHREQATLLQDGMRCRRSCGNVAGAGVG